METQVVLAAVVVTVALEVLDTAEQHLLQHKVMPAVAVNIHTLTNVVLVVAAAQEQLAQMELLRVVSAVTAAQDNFHQLPDHLLDVPVAAVARENSYKAQDHLAVAQTQPVQPTQVAAGRLIIHLPVAKQAVQAL